MPWFGAPQPPRHSQLPMDLDTHTHTHMRGGRRTEQLPRLPLLFRSARRGEGEQQHRREGDAPGGAGPHAGGGVPLAASVALLGACGGALGPEGVQTQVGQWLKARAGPKNYPGRNPRPADWLANWHLCNCCTVVLHFTSQVAVGAGAGGCPCSNWASHQLAGRPFSLGRLHVAARLGDEGAFHVDHEAVLDVVVHQAALQRQGNSPCQPAPQGCKAGTAAQWSGRQQRAPKLVPPPTMASLT